MPALFLQEKKEKFFDLQFHYPVTSIALFRQLKYCILAALFCA
jgi:hypothetical protein